MLDLKSPPEDWGNDDNTTIRKTLKHKAVSKLKKMASTTKRGDSKAGGGSKAEASKEQEQRADELAARVAELESNLARQTAVEDELRAQLEAAKTSNDNRGGDSPKSSDRGRSVPSGSRRSSSKGEGRGVSSDGGHRRKDPPENFNDSEAVVVRGKPTLPPPASKRPSFDFIAAELDQDIDEHHQEKRNKKSASKRSMGNRSRSSRKSSHKKSSSKRRSKQHPKLDGEGNKIPSGSSRDRSKPRSDRSGSKPRDRSKPRQDRERSTPPRDRSKPRDGDRDRSKPRERSKKNPPTREKSKTRFKLDENGHVVAATASSPKGDENKRTGRGEGRKQPSLKRPTDRKKTIANHAKANREAEKKRRISKDWQSCPATYWNHESMTSEASNNIVCEPGLKVELKGKLGLKGGTTSVHAQRFDNIYAAPQEMISNFVAPVYEKTDEDVEFLLDALADNFVFNTLDETELETLVNAFETFEVDEGEAVVMQGETGGHFYILRTGTLAFVVDGNEVGRAAPGNSFGELALLYNAPRAATCLAVDGEAGLWRVDQVTFRKLVAAHTIQNDNMTKDVLRKVPFLSDLDDEFIHRIGEALTTVYYDAGEQIFERGSEGSVFYVIRQGEVEYEHTGRGTKVLGPGNYFGEQAIVKNQPRKANATAVKDTIALALSREVFEKVLGPLPEVIARSNDRRLLRSIPIFANSDIENFEIEIMAALIEEVAYPSEDELLAEGEYVDAPALFLVRSGVLEAYTADGDSRILKSGTFFGEDTLMPDEDQKYGGKGGMKRSSETVEVLDDCVLGKLTLANIDSVILDLGRMGNRRLKGKDMLDRSINIFELRRHTLLGAGTFGQVWLASDRNTGKAYALKVQIKRELIDRHQAKGAVRERQVMSKIDNPFVIKLINTAQDQQSIFMLLNLIQGGELFNVMHSLERDCIPEKETKFYAAGILEGLSYMHRRRIIYRDLKPENVLIDDKGYTVIVDLGFAKVVNDKTYTLCGTPLYLAPEVILNRGHDKGADYWSLACLIYEMILGQTPFYVHNIDQITLFKRIVFGRHRYPPQSFSAEAQDLISGMLASKSTQRLGCLAHAERDIKDHPFFGDINFGKLSKRMIKAPWVPVLRDPLDASCFESWDHLDDKETRGTFKPLGKNEHDIFHEF